MSTDTELLERTRNKDNLKKIDDVILQLRSGNLRSDQKELVEVLNMLMVTGSLDLRARLEDTIVRNINRKNVDNTYTKTKSESVKQQCIAYKLKSK